MREDSVKDDRQLIFAISGYKNSGKTTMIENLIPILTGYGYKVATIKHDAHDFEPDVPGTDTYRHRKAGALGTAIFSGRRWRIERDAKEKISVKELIKAFPDADVILLEGFKNSGYPKYVCSCPEENADASKIAEVILDVINSK